MNKIFKLDFLKILLWANLDLLESISIYIFVNENQKNLPGSIFFPWCMFRPHVNLKWTAMLMTWKKFLLLLGGGGGDDYYSFAAVSSLHWNIKLGVQSFEVVRRAASDKWSQYRHRLPPLCPTPFVRPPTCFLSWGPPAGLQSIACKPSTILGVSGYLPVQSPVILCSRHHASTCPKNIILFLHEKGRH